MSWLDAFFSAGIETVLQAGTVISQRAKLNFIGATVADNPGQNRTDVTITAAPAGTTNQLQVNGGSGAFAAIPYAYSSSLLTSTVDTKATRVATETHLSTSATGAQTIATLALAGITGVGFLRGVVTVTDSTGANTGKWYFDYDFRAVSGSPTNTAGSTATNTAKSGTIAGTEITLAISGTNILVQTTPPSASGLTWHLDMLTSVGVP